MLDERLRTHLIRADLSVRQRVFPLIVPIDPTYPLVVISQPGSTFTNHRDGGMLRRAVKAIKVYADTSSLAWKVANELVPVLQRFPAAIDNIIDDYETQSKRYLVVIYCSIWHTG